MTDISVAIVGAGQLGCAVAERLRDRPEVTVTGPAARDAEMPVLRCGADLVVLATTTRLSDVADAVKVAVEAGSNVIVSAEEASFPWAVDRDTADDIDSMARDRGVTVLGGGVNPGFIFDALVLTLLGTTTGPAVIRVKRTVDISRFGATVLGRLGVGYTPSEFESGVRTGRILGHAGFPQSMAIVADAQGLVIDRIDRLIEPFVSDVEVPLAHRPIPAGHTAGVRQVYTAIVAGQTWYTAEFCGHVDLPGSGLEPADEIDVDADSVVRCVLAPGVGAQAGSAAMIVNSIDRVIAAPPGWLTVADLPPAFPSVRPEHGATRRHNMSGEETG